MGEEMSEGEGQSLGSVGAARDGRLADGARRCKCMQG